jgi:acetyltransferase
VAEQRAIVEMDINPLLASHDRLLALDARIVLHPADRPDAEIPRLAIRPYPRRYVVHRDDGIVIRPIRPEDEPAIIRFHKELSDRSVYFRYLQMMNLSSRVAHERLIRICFVDYDREIALVAERGGEIMAVGRLHKARGSSEAEFALVVADPHQGKGLGTSVLERLIDVARREGLGRVPADIHTDNGAMQRIVRKLGFKLRRELGDPTVTAVLDIPPPERPAIP